LLPARQEDEKFALGSQCAAAVPCGACSGADVCMSHCAIPQSALAPAAGRPGGLVGRRFLPSQGAPKTRCRSFAAFSSLRPGKLPAHWCFAGGATQRQIAAAAAGARAAGGRVDGGPAAAAAALGCMRRAPCSGPRDSGAEHSTLCNMIYAASAAAARWRAGAARCRNSGVGGALLVPFPCGGGGGGRGSPHIFRRFRRGAAEGARG